jgi:diadenosine tetraphosphate (Ap4A) HIT family hydrolase
MAELAPWSELRDGISCPFDLPRTTIGEHMIVVRQLSISSLYLAKEQTYRGACVLIFDPRHVTRIDELSAQEWATFAADLKAAEAAVFRSMKPDHINVESLGSVVPHLHWHIIPRYRSDPRWGGPIWTTRKDEMPRTELSDSEYAALKASIDEALANAA